jgi:8-oxo-dGTP pyrophosphatase MutT (NUDIX family)
MKTLKIITEKDINYQTGQDEWRLKSRDSARAVVLNDRNETALLNVQRAGIYKLPGGGVKNNETIEEGLRREVLEEIGYEIEIIAELGKTIERKVLTSKENTSYNYLAKTIGDQKQIDLTKNEKYLGFKPEWYLIDKAIELVKNEVPKDYTQGFIKERDLLVLKEAKNILNKSA